MDSRATTYLKRYKPWSRGNAVWLGWYRHTPRPLRAAATSHRVLLSLGLVSLFAPLLFSHDLGLPRGLWILWVFAALPATVWAVWLWSVPWTRRFTLISPEMVEHINPSLQGHPDWSEIIAGWALVRPLIYADYLRWLHATVLAEKEEKEAARLAEERQRRLAAEILLAAGPIGASLTRLRAEEEQQRLEKGSPAPQSSVSACAPHRL